MTSEALDGVSKLGEFCFLFKTTPSDYNLFFWCKFPQVVTDEVAGHSDYGRTFVRRTVESNCWYMFSGDSKFSPLVLDVG